MNRPHDGNGKPLDVPFEPYVEGGRAFLAGIEVTDQLRDCARCPNCGIFGRKELVGATNCFRCRPRAPKAPALARGRDYNTQAVLLVAAGVAIGLLVMLLLGR